MSAGALLSSDPPAPAGGLALALDRATVARWDADAQAWRHLLDAVSLEVRTGEHWVVLGPNGAGKTTLMRLLGAVDQPTEGAVHVLGRRLGRVDVRALRERIGFVEPRLSRELHARLTLREVVLTGVTGSIALQRRRLTGVHAARAAELLALVGCAGRGDEPYARCSQGERQRVLLARAMMADPPLLLLDEPTTGLDLPGREAFLARLGALARARPALTTVTVTHHLEEIPAHATHGLLLRGGKVLAAGPLAATITSEHVSACFGLDVAVERVGDRFLAAVR